MEEYAPQQVIVETINEGAHSYRLSRPDPAHLETLTKRTTVDLIDESNTSMALTEIKQTPLIRKAVDLESSLSLCGTDVKDKKKRNHFRDPKE